MKLFLRVGASSIILLFLILPWSPVMGSLGIPSTGQASQSDLQLLTDRIVDPSLPDLFPQVNTSTLQDYVQDLQDFGPHPTGSPALEEVKEYLYTTLSGFPLALTVDEWETKKKAGENIIATLPGMGSTNGIMIVCAHMIPSVSHRVQMMTALVSLRC
jgi:hypothetical protein